MNALLVLTSAILFLALINLWLWHRRKFAQFLHSSGSTPGKISSDLAALNAGSIGLGERLLRIERNQKILADRLQQLELHDRNNATYNQAINLIKQGINKKDLISSCELSEAEAGLLMMMHDKKKQKPRVSH